MFLNWLKALDVGFWDGNTFSLVLRKRLIVPLQIRIYYGIYTIVVFYLIHLYVKGHLTTIALLQKEKIKVRVFFLWTSINCSTPTGSINGQMWAPAPLVFKLKISCWSIFWIFDPRKKLDYVFLFNSKLDTLFQWVSGWLKFILFFLPQKKTSLFFFPFLNWLRFYILLVCLMLNYDIGEVWAKGSFLPLK